MAPLLDLPALPPIPREFRAAWVATVDNIDWPSKRTLTVAEQKSEMIRILNVAAALKLNAIVFQVRPSADALYNSKLEPWSEYLTGEQGKAPSPKYDPLAFTVAEAHKRGIEVHCWFNPYRAKHPAQKGPLAPSHIGVAHPEVVKSYGKYLWMDPGEPLVVQHSLAVIKDVVKRYDVDGVHIDDYFYPYPEKGVDFPDEPSYAKYKAKGGTLELADWRRKNVDDFVRQMYQTVKATKKWVKVGISPFGIYRPGNPSTIKTTFDQYAMLYADAKKWLAEGWCDYYSPQLYWSSKTPDQNYGDLLNWWVQANEKKRHLWPGNYTSRVGPEESKKFTAQEIVDQIDITRKTAGSTGNVHFSMKAFTANWGGVRDAVAKSYASEAWVPSSPWLSKKAPSKPKIVKILLKKKTFKLSWTPGAASYAVAKYDGHQWLNWSKPATGAKFSGHYLGDKERLAIVAFDRYGNASKPLIVDLRG